MAKYTIGLDYGTLSGRALIVNAQTGEELASSVFDYPHAVMDEYLPSGKKLGNDWALQHPQDYLDVIYNTIPDVMKKSGVMVSRITIALNKSPSTTMSRIPFCNSVRLFAIERPSP